MPGLWLRDRVCRAGLWPSCFKFDVPLWPLVAAMVVEVSGRSTRSVRRASWLCPARNNPAPQQRGPVMTLSAEARIAKFLAEVVRLFGSPDEPLLIRDAPDMKGIVMRRSDCSRVASYATLICKGGPRPSSSRTSPSKMSAMRTSGNRSCISAASKNALCATRRTMTSSLTLTATRPRTGRVSRLSCTRPGSHSRGN